MTSSADKIPPLSTAEVLTGIELCRRLRASSFVSKPIMRSSLITRPSLDLEPWKPDFVLLSYQIGREVPSLRHEVDGGPHASPASRPASEIGHFEPVARNDRGASFEHLLGYHLGPSADTDDDQASRRDFLGRF